MFRYRVAALTVAVDFSLAGTPVTVGLTRAQVVRSFSGGIAVEFLRMVSADEFGPADSALNSSFVRIVLQLDRRSSKDRNAEPLASLELGSRPEARGLCHIRGRVERAHRRHSRAGRRSAPRPAEEYRSPNLSPGFASCRGRPLPPPGSAPFLLFTDALFRESNEPRGVAWPPFGDVVGRGFSQAGDRRIVQRALHFGW